MDEIAWTHLGPAKHVWNNELHMHFEMIDTKNSSTAYVVMYKLIT